MAEDNSLTCETDAPEGVSNKVFKNTHQHFDRQQRGVFSISNGISSKNSGTEPRE
jgi:hypothetical protein